MGDQPRAIDELVAGLEPRRPDAGAARHHRLRQDLHDGAGHRADPAPDADHRAQQDARAPALRRSSRSCSPTTPSTTSSATTTTTSPRRTSRRPTRSSRRTRSINEEIDRMRHAATYALLTRRDVVIVASVSCIYGIGAAEAYLGMKLDLAQGRRGAARRGAAPAGRDPVRAQRRRLPPRHLPRARRHRRDLPGLRARDGDPHRVVRRRDRDDLRGRSAARQGAAQDRRGVDLPRLALRDAGRSR